MSTTATVSGLYIGEASTSSADLSEAQLLGSTHLFDTCTFPPVFRREGAGVFESCYDRFSFTVVRAKRFSTLV